MSGFWRYVAFNFTWQDGFAEPPILAMSETTVAATLTFILAMCRNPEIQCKAQQEIDNVVGLDRLPDFLDESRLPYLSAVLKEVLRFVVFRDS